MNDPGISKEIYHDKNEAYAEQKIVQLINTVSACHKAINSLSEGGTMIIISHAVNRSFHREPFAHGYGVQTSAFTYSAYSCYFNFSVQINYT